MKLDLLLDARDELDLVAKLIDAAHMAARTLSDADRAPLCAVLDVAREKAAEVADKLRDVQAGEADAD